MGIAAHRSLKPSMRNQIPGCVGPGPKTLRKEFTQYLLDNGCKGLTRTKEGSWCALLRFNFTWGLVVGLNESGYARRYCYEHEVDAAVALKSWDGAGHPKGPWIKCKGAGIDLLNPELTGE